MLHWHNYTCIYIYTLINVSTILYAILLYITIWKYPYMVKWDNPPARFSTWIHRSPLLITTITKEPESAADQPKAENKPSEIGGRPEPPRTRSCRNYEHWAISLGFLPVKQVSAKHKDVIRMSRDIQIAFETTRLTRLIDLKLHSMNNEDLFQLALTKQYSVAVLLLVSHRTSKFLALVLCLGSVLWGRAEARGNSKLKVHSSR